MLCVKEAEEVKCRVASGCAGEGGKCGEGLEVAGVARTGREHLIEQ